MIVSELKLYDFRKFHSENDKPGLSISFHRGVNALIGENDSGKTAVIDALKLILLTQSNDYVRPTEEDFYLGPDNECANEFRIECVLSEFAANEAMRVNRLMELDMKVSSEKRITALQHIEKMKKEFKNRKK